MLRVDVAARRGAFDLAAALEVPQGGCLALAGPSGAGKTTLLRIVAGLLRPQRGRVACGEALWLDRARGIDVPPERRGCGFVFQDYALFDHLSAWRNVAYGMRGLSRGQRRTRALELLERFGVAHLADADPRRLSGGERQRVALARALATRPRALLLDEPLTALDARTRGGAARALAALLRELAAPAVLVTHDFTEAALLADEVAVIDAGRIVQRGAPALLAASPATAFVADFTGASVLTGSVRREATPGVDPGLTVVDLDGGGTVTATAAGVGEVAIAIQPWEIALEPAGSEAHGSARNRLDVEVVSVTEIGNRVRLGLAVPQPLVAEVTRDAVVQLALAPGARAVATWKAAATRVLAR
jgi:molybdate transport system ATP-binding protein